MKQRGRKSAAQLATVSEIGARRPAPPDRLCKKGQSIWREVTTSKPEDWFDDSNLPLLEEFCRIKVSLDLLNEIIAKVEAQLVETATLPEGYAQLATTVDKKQGRLVTLACKMRLTQQAKYDAQTALSRQKRAPAKVAEKLWQG